MITTCQNISAQHRTCIIIIVIEYWSIKVAYRINGELVSPTEGLLNALMLLYADDLVLLAPEIGERRVGKEC